MITAQAGAPPRMRWDGRRVAVAAYNRAKPDAASVLERSDETEPR